MSKIADAFAQRAGQTALITYLTAGDPNREMTLQLMHAAADAGADIIELGIPFTDPMADGPVIQRAAERALANGTSLRDVLDIAAQFRQNNRHTPVVLMGYLNPIHKMGYAAFAQAASDAGIDGVLTVDMPIEHAEPLQQELAQYQIDTIYLVAPTTDEARIAAIGKVAGGFIYCVSLKGVTGAAQFNADAVAEKIALIRRHTSLPIGVGFGISDPESARRMAQYADAVIVGSRLVAEIEQQPNRAVEAASELVRSFKNALI